MDEKSTRAIQISDITMKQLGGRISFANKLELSKQLLKLNLSVIELEGVSDLWIEERLREGAQSGTHTERLREIDLLRVRLVASAARGTEGVVAVPVRLGQVDGARRAEYLERKREEIGLVWAALGEADAARLQLSVPVRQWDAEAVRTLCACCAETARNSNVELIAEDATQAEPERLAEVVRAALSGGARIVTLRDPDGDLLPNRFAEFLDDLQARVPELQGATLGVDCSNALCLAQASAIAALEHGAEEVKVCSYPAAGRVFLPELLPAMKSEKLRDLKTGLTLRTEARTVEMTRILERIAQLFEGRQGAFDQVQDLEALEEEIRLAPDAARDAILSAAEKLGRYNLSESEIDIFYASFRRIAQRKESLNGQDLLAIIDAEGYQRVPSTYALESYLITTDNDNRSMAHVRLRRLDNDELMERARYGNGPINAAFHAIRKILNRHYEMSDFKIHTVSNSSAALGEAAVTLKAYGKAFEGRGISTDIVEASIRAYLSAINQIIYEGERGEEGARV